MTKKLIYIAGKISGEPKNDCLLKFNRAENELRDKGYKVFNPVAYIEMYNDAIELSGGVRLTDEKDRKTIMKICITNLMDGDALYLLPDWQESKGATLEATIAKSLGLEVINAE